MGKGKRSRKIRSSNKAVKKALKQQTTIKALQTAQHIVTQYCDMVKAIHGVNYINSKSFAEGGIVNGPETDKEKAETINVGVVEETILSEDLQKKLMEFAQP